MPDPTPPHHVVVVGGGFGGIETVRGLRGAGVRITLIDRRNHHIFQPLLYQAATASLAPAQIAWPIRALLRARPDVTVLLNEVTAVDTAASRVLLDDGSALPFDTLVLATGARHAYFGHDDWERFAPGLKTIEDATAIRRRILLAFEHAERTADPARRQALLTFVVVGGGPTGVELAGTIAELAKDTLARDFRRIDPQAARVVLVEAGPAVLPGYPPDLMRYTHDALQRIGVDLLLGRAVTACSAEGVVVGDEPLPAATILWAAGVRASPAAEWLQAPHDKAGRIQVLPDLAVPGYASIFAIGDTVAIAGPGGHLVPAIAPAAKQQGRHVAAVIRARLAGDATPRPFAYRHAGSLAQIGKRRAVADFGWIRLRGAIAWWIWGIAHIYFLIDAPARFSVALTWLWIYLRNERSARLITAAPQQEPPAPPA